MIAVPAEPVPVVLAADIPPRRIAPSAVSARSVAAVSTGLPNTSLTVAVTVA